MSVSQIKHCLLLALIVAAVQVGPALAETLNQKKYADKYTLYNMRSQYGKDVNLCLQNWGNKHPFKNMSQFRFRVVENNVKVFGVGDNFTDNSSTIYPQMILIRPAVNVMGKMEYNLANPNGWYCLDSNVTVMGKSVINLACDAKLTSTHGSITVMGKSSSDEKSGTTVLGKTVIKRLCPEKK